MTPFITTKQIALKLKDNRNLALILNDKSHYQMLIGRYKHHRKMISKGLLVQDVIDLFDEEIKFLENIIKEK